MKKVYTSICAAIIAMATVTDASAIEALSIVGSATYGGDGAENSLAMVKSADNADVFTYMGYLKAEGDFHFTYASSPADAETEVFTLAADGSLVQDATGSALKVTEDANYVVTVNTADLTVTVDKADYQTTPVQYNALGLYGSATTVGWDNLHSIPMVWGGQENPMTFTLTTDIKSEGWSSYRFTTNPNFGNNAHSISPADTSNPYPAYCVPTAYNVEPGETSANFYITGVDGNGNFAECALTFTINTENKTITVNPIQQLQIIGGAMPFGWNTDNGMQMVKDSEDTNIFRYMGWLKADEEFKFQAQNNYSNLFGLKNADSDPYTIEKVRISDDDWKFKVSESANYEIVINLSDMAISVTKAAYQENPVYYNTLFILGMATEAAWDPSKAIPLTWGGTENPFEFKGKVNLTDGGNFKFITNSLGGFGSTTFYPGGDDNSDMSKITSVKIADDPNWTAPGSGQYDFAVNLLNNTISYKKDTTTAITTVCEDDSLQPVEYFNLQGIKVSNPDRGIFIRRQGKQVSKVLIR